MLAFDPSSAGLLAPADTVELRRLLTALKTAEQTSAQRQMILAQMQQLLDDALEHD
jgi:hypothetical protein